MPRKKSFRYTPDDLISEYNEDLYKDVSGQIEITLFKQPCIWTHSIEHGKAIIGYCFSDTPEADFAHILLHIKAELNWLKAPDLSSAVKITNWQTLDCVMHQLAHHRIYPEFIEMGFTKKVFVRRNEHEQNRVTIKNAIPQLEDLCKEHKELLTGFSILIPYLLCISPDEERKEMMGFKKSIVNLAKSSFIKQVDDIMEEWVSKERMDYCATLSEIFWKCGKGEVGF